MTDRDREEAREREARDLDREDPLAPFRARFHVPEGIYLDGNSLGLLSVDAEASLARALGEWRSQGIGGWLGGAPPWFGMAEGLGARVAPLIGAAPGEVVATGTTTGNLHALVAAFFEPTRQRRKILAAALEFPSDIYALRGQLGLRGLDPSADLVLVPSRDGRTVDEADVEAHMTDDVALAVLPSVLYRSGQLLDMRRLTDAAHARGIVIGWDCSHSVGAVPHELSAWGADFAVFCGYKYLGGGPGSPAFLYVSRRHDARAPLLAGWFGSAKDVQFDMGLELRPARGAGRFQISTPSVLASAPLEGALDVMHEATLARVRAKSLRMTDYLVELVDGLLGPLGFTVGTPRDPSRRGGHVAIEHDRAASLCLALKGRGIVPDFRPPNVIRLAPVALYNTFHEVFRAVIALRAIAQSGEHERFGDGRSAVP